MDEIYTILANTSFIPHDSIKHGPHQINSTASPCKRDPADLRLMEILPYVDRTLFEDLSWLWGGWFVNYRKDEDLRYEHATLRIGCHRSWADDPSYFMTPGIVHLTHGGWDGYRSWKLQYGTRKNAMRIYEGEERLEYMDPYKDSYAKEPGYGWNNISVFGGSNTTGSLTVNRHSRHWTEWTDAPTFLRRIRDAYLSAAWSPWETSNPDGQWGIQSSNYTSALLLKNGWPGKFDIDQFRADFIRAQHKPSERGWAEAAFQHIKTHKDDPDDPFNIYHKKKRLQWRQSSIGVFEETGSYTGDITDGESLWYTMRMAEDARDEIDRQERDFEDAKQQIQRLCPNDICVEEEDLILWELRELEKTYTKAQLEPNAPTMCERRIREWERLYITHLPPDQLSKCITQLNLERHWLQLAYQQSRADALAHCARNSKHLLPPASFETLASLRTAD